MKKFILSLLAVLLAVFLHSCQDSLYYTSYQDLPQSRWDNNDTISFSIPPTETDLDVALTLGVRSTHDYQYSDLVARIEVLCDGTPLSSVPLTINLYADGQHPDGLTRLIDESYSRPQALHLQANHQYAVLITHLMSLNPIPGISSLGIIVEK